MVSDWEKWEAVALPVVRTNLWGEAYTELYDWYPWMRAFYSKFEMSYDCLAVRHAPSSSERRRNSARRVDLWCRSTTCSTAVVVLRGPRASLPHSTVLSGCKSSHAAGPCCLDEDIAAILVCFCHCTSGARKFPQASNY